MPIAISVALKGRRIDRFEFAKDRVMIGREPGSDIFLDNTGISREHACIKNTHVGFLVEDLHSANGIFVNDERVRNACFLAENDVITIGKFALSVEAISLTKMATTAPLDAPEPPAKPVGSLPGAFAGTILINSDDLDLELDFRDADGSKPSKPTARKINLNKSAPHVPSRTSSGLLGLAFLGGVAVGILLSWLSLHFGWA